MNLKPYTNYNESEISWIGKIPEHWKIDRGKNILTQLKRPVKHDDDIITCFRDGEVTLRNKRRETGFTMSDKEIGYQGIEKYDLVVHGMDGFAGSIGISDSRGKGSPVLIVLNSNQNKKYLMYYLRDLAYNNVFLALSTGIRVRSCDLRWEKLANIMYLIPPLIEQYQIANYLDNKVAKIDATIDMNKTLIQLLEEKRITLIHHVVTKGLDSNAQLKDSNVKWIGAVPKHWKIDKLKKYFNINNGSTPKDIEENWGGNICWVTPSDYKTTDVYINQSSRQITKIGLNSCGTTLVPKGSIIISNRAPIGTVAIANTELCTNQGCKSLSIKREINTKFVYYVLSVNGNELNKLGRGTTFMELSSYDLGTFQIPIAPLSEQSMIVEYLDNKIDIINKIIKKINLNIRLFEEYKTSLIHNAITGKIDVRSEEI